MLLFAKSRDITQRLVSDNTSIFNKIVMQSMIQIKGIKPRNTAIVCLDGSSDEIGESYRGAVEGIRTWCYANGRVVNLSRIYGSNVEVYTTPAGGSFFLTLGYKKRYLALSLEGRDLYIMGWRSPHGTFELKILEQLENYMAGTCITFNVKANYRFVSPKAAVGNTVMGPLALQMAFEILYKCRGVMSDQLMWAIGILAVHFPEAARIQSVLNDACTSFCPGQVATLDSNTPKGMNSNSFFVSNWDTYAHLGMKRVHQLLKGEIPTPIHNPKGAVLKLRSGVEIFKQIRILPRDAFDEWPFKHEKRPERSFEGPLDDGSSGKPSQKHFNTAPKKRGKKASEDSEEDVSGGSDGGYPSYCLLDEWGPDLDVEEITADEIRKENQNDNVTQEIDDEEEQHAVKRKDEAAISGPGDVTIGDYLDHFTMVRKMVSFNRRTPHFEVPVFPSLVDAPAYLGAREVASYRRWPNFKQMTSSGQIKSGCVTSWTRHKAPPLRPLQRNLSRACSLVTRILRFI